MLIAITVVVSAKIVGIVFESAFLVIPAATARILARHFSVMTLMSIVIGAFSVLLGLWLSYAIDLPSGAAIVLVEMVFFAIALFFAKSVFHK